MLLAFARQLLHIDPRHRPELKHLLDTYGQIKQKSAENQGKPILKCYAVCLLLKFVFNHHT